MRKATHESPSKALGLGMVAIVLVALALRPSIVSIGPILPRIIETFALSHAQASLLTTIPDLLMGMLALPAPWLAHRFGRDKTIVTALAILCACTLARAFAPDVLALLLTTVGVGAGIAITGTLLSGYIKVNYPTRAAWVMGLYVTGLSCGSTLSAVITAPMAEHAGGWRLPAGVWSVVGLLATLAWGYVYWRHTRAHDASQQTVTARAPLPWRNALAWRIAGFFACVNLIFYAMVTWTAAVFLEHGLSSSMAGLLLGCFTAAFMLASPVFGAFSKSLDRRAWLLASAVMTLLGLVVMTLAPLWAPLPMMAFTAFGLGGAFTLGMTLPLDNTANAAETNAWTAFVLTIGYLVAATGPLAFGYLRDVTGSYASSLYLLVAMAGLMIVMACWLKPASIRAG
ncbi:MAG TPA: MFS transporter [Methylovorus sp.]|nr:MFS transporter [Methylovorus sp.]